jgi:REP-associated tyrosine transposase
MARPLRVEFPGAWFHVTARGNERRAIFRSDVDRRRWLQLAAELPGRFGLRVHGYVLMPNHYHLIVETGAAGLSRPMQWLNLSYTMWFNRRHRRVGHLFQGRFKAILVEVERWGLELSRYVHLNPVRIERLGLGKSGRAERRLSLSAASSAQQIAERLRVLREFGWSSYGAYIGWEEPPVWLCVETLRSLGGRPRRKAKRSYRAYVEEAIREGLEESPWERVEAQLVLGGAALKQKARSLLRGSGRERSGVRQLRRREFGAVMAVVSQLKGEAWEDFRDRYADWGRDLALWLGRTHCDLRLRELGELAGGLDYATVSAATGRWRKRMANDKSLAKLTKRAGQLLNAKI